MKKTLLPAVVSLLTLAACADPPPAIIGEACTVPSQLAANECMLREASLGDCSATADCADGQFCVQAGTFGVCLAQDDGQDPPRCAVVEATSFPLKEFGTDADVFACVEDTGVGCSSDLVCADIPGASPF